MPDQENRANANLWRVLTPEESANHPFNTNNNFQDAMALALSQRRAAATFVPPSGAFRPMNYEQWLTVTAEEMRRLQEALERHTPTPAQESFQDGFMRATAEAEPAEHPSIATDPCIHFL